MYKVTDTDLIREDYADHRYEYARTPRQETRATFDAWLAGVKAEAWDEGFDAGRDDLGAADVARDHGEDENPYRQED